MLAISFFQGLESEKFHQLKFDDNDVSSFPPKTAIPKLANISEVWAETKNFYGLFPFPESSLRKSQMAKIKLQFVRWYRGFLAKCNTRSFANSDFRCQ